MLRFGLLFLTAVSFAFPQSKIAVINSQLAVIDTAEIKKAQAELETKFRPRQSQAEKLTKELQDLQSQIQQGQGRLTPQAEQNLQVTGQRKQRELQRLNEDLQQDVDRERQEILQRTGGRMQEVVRKLAEEKGFDLVVDTSNTIFFKPGLDITKEATAAYDKAYPAN